MNPAKEAMEKVLGTTATVGQSGPVFDPMAKQNADLDALRAQNDAMAASLGLQPSTLSATPETPEHRAAALADIDRARASTIAAQNAANAGVAADLSAFRSKYPVLPTHSQMYRAAVAGHPYDFKNTTYRLPFRDELPQGSRRI
jgi:hypothetical protein